MVVNWKIPSADGLDGKKEALALNSGVEPLPKAIFSSGVKNKYALFEICGIIEMVPFPSSRPFMISYV
jgi:hypothetical protein